MAYPLSTVSQAISKSKTGERTLSSSFNPENADGATSTPGISHKRFPKASSWPNKASTVAPGEPRNVVLRIALPKQVRRKYGKAVKALLILAQSRELIGIALQHPAQQNVDERSGEDGER